MEAGALSNMAYGCGQGTIVGGGCGSREGTGARVGGLPRGLRFSHLILTKFCFSQLWNGVVSDPRGTQTTVGPWIPPFHPADMCPPPQQGSPEGRAEVGFLSLKSK